jgi:hypothetical protein
VPEQPRWPVSTAPVNRPESHSSAIAEILDQEDEAWSLYVRGYTYRQIAKELGRSSNWAHLTVHRLLELRETGRQQMVRAQIEKLLDEVSLIRQSAWSGWNRSQADKVRTVEKTKEVGPRGGGGDESITTTEAQAGNASFLRVLIECNKRESALRGIEKPTAVLYQCMQPSLDIDALILQVEAANAQELQTHQNVSEVEPREESRPEEEALS